MGVMQIQSRSCSSEPPVVAACGQRVCMEENYDDTKG